MWRTQCVGVHTSGVVCNHTILARDGKAAVTLARDGMLRSAGMLAPRITDEDPVWGLQAGSNSTTARNLHVHCRSMHGTCSCSTAAHYLGRIGSRRAVRKARSSARCMVQEANMGHQMAYGSGSCCSKDSK